MPMEQMPGGEDFLKRFRERFGEPEVYSPYGYDATRVLVAAMLQADSTEPVKYLPTLANIKHAGVTSPEISYDEHGDFANGGVTVYQVRQGKWEVMQTIE
ncbi:MAG: hypothetical protein BSR46_10075 [Candidatus Dactylopiibacterium carminicum]|nr:MAG: hypothetical protein BSR46_10075 [Candidatus Dactylopiibacterium carminicum]